MPPFISKLSPEQWAEARSLRAGGAGLREVAHRFGLTHSTVRDRARRERWPAPGTTVPGAVVRKAVAAARKAANRRGDPASGTADVRRALAHRVLRIFEIELTIMELRMLNRLEDAGKKDLATEPDPANEADLRRVQNIIKTIDDVTELEADTEPNTGGRGYSKSGAGDAPASEADAFRNEIAERLAKLIPPS